MSLSAYNYPSPRETDTTSVRFVCYSSAQLCLGTAKRATTGEALNKIYDGVSSATRFTQLYGYQMYRISGTRLLERYRFFQTFKCIRLFFW